MYVTDGDNAVDDEDAHFGEHKIRAYAPSDKLNRCAVCAHTPGSISILDMESH